MFKNSHLRLLMTTSGLQRDGLPSEETRDSAWIVPSEVKANDLKDMIHYINQAEFNPPTFDEGVSAENQLRRKTVPRKKAAFDDDDGDEEDDGADFLDDEMLFPAGGPTARKAIDGPDGEKKKIRRRKRKDGEQLTEEDLDDKARKRRERELEKARKIKSALYVNPGDDEFDSDEDEAFFAREREIAAKAAQAAGMATATIIPEKATTKKRKSTALLDDDSDVEEQDEDESVSVPRVLSSQDNEGSETDDTPVDGSDVEGKKKKRRLSPEDDEEDASGDEGDIVMSGTSKAPAPSKDDEDGEDDVPVPVRRPRVRGGFIIDSDDDE